MRERAGRLDEDLLGSGERIRPGLAGPYQRLGRSGRDLTPGKGLRHPRHLLERAGHADRHAVPQHPERGARFSYEALGGWPPGPLAP